MKKEILLVGENTLLKLKLISILSRSRFVNHYSSIQEAERFLRNMRVDCTIFCDYYFYDLMQMKGLEHAGHLICLASRNANDACCDVPQSDDVMQILYDQIYGFSGYRSSSAATVPLADPSKLRVHPVLVDDIAFWISCNMDADGLYDLRGPEAVLNNDFLRALSMEDPVYEVLPEGAISRNGLASVVLLRHTLAQGISVMRHQQSCAVNLIYKLPLFAPISGTTVGAVRERLGAMAGLLLPEELRSKLDYICPVPNSGIPYASAAATATGLPLVHAIEKKTADRSFHIEDEVIRRNMIASTMQIDADRIRGKRICLVDEAIFTGSTLKILCGMLRACGAEEIHVLIPTPPCTAQCQYCSIPTRPMLLETVPQEALAEELGVDSVIFQAKATLMKLLRETYMTCCDCFS